MSLESLVHGVAKGSNSTSLVHEPFLSNHRIVSHLMILSGQGSSGFGVSVLEGSFIHGSIYKFPEQMQGRNCFKPSSKFGHAYNLLAASFQSETVILPRSN